MTRRFLDDIRDDINGFMADNSTGNFTLAEDRTIRLDMLDSLKQDEASVNGSSPVSFNVTSVFQVMQLVYDSSNGGDAEFLKVDLPNGVIVLNTTPGFSYRVAAEISMEGINNTHYDFAIGIDGVPGNFISQITGNGVAQGRPISTSAVRFVPTANADAVISFMVKSPDGASTITVNSIGMLVAVIPTNNP